MQNVTYSVGVTTYVPNIYMDMGLTAEHFTNGTLSVWAHFMEWGGFSSTTLAGLSLYSRVYNVTDNVLVRHTYAGQAFTVQAACHSKAFGMAFQTFDTSYIGKVVRFEMAYYSDAQWTSDGNDAMSMTCALVGTT